MPTPPRLQIPYLTFWEVVHYWFHAACEVLVANDYTRKIGKTRPGYVSSSHG